MKNRTANILAAVITVAYFAYLLVVSPWIDRHRQDKLFGEGKVGIVNFSGHEVALTLFGHDSAGAVCISELRLDADSSELVMREQMDTAEMFAFPPVGMIDSALIVFDGSVVEWHVPQRGGFGQELLPPYSDHRIYRREHWRLATVTVTGWSRFHPRTYYYVRRYILTPDDYRRAVECNK